MEYSVEAPYVQTISDDQEMKVSLNKRKQKLVAKVYPCVEVKNSPDSTKSAYNSFIILGKVYTALGYKVNRKIDDFDLPQLVRDSTKMYVINPPQHGQLVQSSGDKEAGLYSYQSQAGYVGKDTFTVGVDTISKSRAKISYSLQFKVSVVESITNDQYPSTCSN
ncbi:hypothetical protein RF679_01070 [Undibacterium cyanobacteriorum]|uniref:Uncharacterized protein n=1 Tax=Undibacterium cyanobacteriorum TaxID=3073561 RepID=A0ABY9RI40_9BURK|nr:hypothetical protein [Undibacterium sp. 20NA77.5]WMW80887.1 hypothetical protein RF679_01070 [Undibacterium sp. 20NA77.5]